MSLFSKHKLAEQNWLREKGFEHCKNLVAETSDLQALSKIWKTKISGGTVNYVPSDVSSVSEVFNNTSIKVESTALAAGALRGLITVVSRDLFKFSNKLIKFGYRHRYNTVAPENLYCLVVIRYDNGGANPDDVKTALITSGFETSFNKIEGSFKFPDMSGITIGASARVEMFIHSTSDLAAFDYEVTDCFFKTVGFNEDESQALINAEDSQFFGDFGFDVSSANGYAGLPITEPKASFIGVPDLDFDKSELIFQWGKTSSTVGAHAFPKAFPNGCLGVALVATADSGRIGYVSAKTASNFTWGVASFAFDTIPAQEYLAIGY